MGSKGPRKIYLDIARSIAMIWIVGWWHLISYTNDEGLSYRFDGDESITMLMLGTFMFISGLCIGMKSFNNSGDVISFYKNRFWRFYVLYIISATTMPLFTLLNRSIPLWFTTVTVSSTFILPQPYTLWFMSMLAVFYILTPLLKHKFALYGGGTLLLMIGLNLLLPNGIDTRVFVYYPLYLLGLFVSDKDWLDKMINKRYLLLIFLCLSIILFFLSMKYSFLLYLFIVIGICTLLLVSKVIETTEINGFVSFISFSSLCAYLFHRQIYSLLVKVVGNELVVLIIIAFPICICLSWLFQKMYDLAVKKLLANQNK